MIIAIDIKYIYKFEQEGKFGKGASFKQKLSIITKAYNE